MEGETLTIDLEVTHFALSSKGGLIMNLRINSAKDMIRANIGEYVK